MPALQLIPRLEDDCKAWGCLTKAEQFGIIFSIVVTSIVLILAYMYYLGRITDAHQERVAAARLRRRRRRERRRRDQFPAGIALTQAPVIQQLATLPPQVSYQPTAYHIPAASVLHPYPPLIPAYYYPQQAAPQGHCPPQPAPNIHPTHARRSGSHRQHRGHHARERQQDAGERSSRSASLSSPGLPPRQPTWRQRLNRVFGITVGRASTIASSSPSRTPTRSRSRSRSRPRSQSRDTHQAPEPEPRVSGSRRGSFRSPQTPQRVSNVAYRRLDEDEVSSEDPESHDTSDHGTDRAVSPQTDAATVHSDDYELAPAPTQFVVDYRRNGEGPECEPLVLEAPAREIGNGFNPDKDLEHLPSSDGQDSLPSVSSLHSDFSPDLRPSVSMASKPDGSVRA